MASKVKKIEKPRPYNKLERFALATLQIMESDEEWGADTLDGIMNIAVKLKLAGGDPFKRTAAGKWRETTKK